jgi:N-acetyl-gamma-glutamyl-phosphate reductase
VSESFKAYGVSGHRHYPEIKQELALLAGESVGLTFVPHLVPMIRGMQATLYVDLLDNTTLPYFSPFYGNKPICSNPKFSSNPNIRFIF